MTSLYENKVPVKGYKELNVWQKSIELVDIIYDYTTKFPSHELYGLTSQLRRAAVSVPTNIAEGSARNGTKEFVQFLGIAKGSLAEIETLLIICKKRSYLNDIEIARLDEITNSVGKLLYGLQRKLLGNS